MPINVYTCGTFDLLHYNHINMIKNAKKLGDLLIVGVNTDDLVVTLKKNPPILSYDERFSIISSIKDVDIVVPQKTLNLQNILKNMNINIFVVGDDWEGNFDELKKTGIEVYYFPRGVGISSSKLKEKIINPNPVDSALQEIDNK